MILAYFSKELRNFVVIFRAFGRKCKLWEILRKFFKKFLMTIVNNALFSMFSKNVINPAFIFRAFGRKTQLLESFGKIFENFHKNIAKNALFLHNFQKNSTSHALIFCAFGPKTQIVGKFSMKILLKNWIFNFIFRKNLLLKIEPSEITPVFYNNFFGFGGGGISPLPPWLRPWV